MHETITQCSSEDLSCLEMELWHLYKFPRNFFLKFHFLLVIYSFFLSSCMIRPLSVLWFVLFGSALLENESCLRTGVGNLQQRFCLCEWRQRLQTWWVHKIHPWDIGHHQFHVGQNPFGWTVTSRALKVFNFFLKSQRSNPLSWRWSVPGHELLQCPAVVCMLSACMVTHPAWPIISKITTDKQPSEKILNVFLGFGF